MGGGIGGRDWDWDWDWIGDWGGEGGTLVAPSNQGCVLAYAMSRSWALASFSFLNSAVAWDIVCVGDWFEKCRGGLFEHEYRTIDPTEFLKNMAMIKSIVFVWVILGDRELNITW